MTKPSPAYGRSLLDEVVFDGNGLVPVVTQQHGGGEVLMLAWMNREALSETLRTGEAHYWSRSRGALWRKGEESGQTQRVIELRIDCDGDALLLLVEQTGVACHTGRRTCFFRTARTEGFETVVPAASDPAELYRRAQKS